MAPHGSETSPGISITRGGTKSLKCPKCGHSNQVNPEYAQKGFICSACGEHIGGGGGKPNPAPNPVPSAPFSVVKCPKCGNSKNLQIAPGEDGQIHFRCSSCQAEW